MNVHQIVTVYDSRTSRTRYQMLMKDGTPIASYDREVLEALIHKENN